MRKIFLVGLFLIGCASLCEATVRPSTGSRTPEPQMMISEAVYYTSFTCVESDRGSIAIATHTSFLYSVRIASAGTGSPTVQIYDSQRSSTAVHARQIGFIDARTIQQSFYNLGLSSGLVVNNHATGTPACLEIIYMDRFNLP